MLEVAYRLARRGHRPEMIEALLVANGFPELSDLMNQLNFRRELKAIADQARRSAREGQENA
jgi:hypothetical protein